MPLPKRRINGDDQPAVEIRLDVDMPDELLDPLLCGLEEEGVPAVIGLAAGQASAVQLAKAAADSSKVNVGLGINRTEGLVVLHHHDLAPDRPLQVHPLEGDPAGLRRLGANAGRLVKGDPLLFEDRLSTGGENKSDSPAGAGEDRPFTRRQVDELAALIIKALQTSSD
ncbi:MAG: glycerol dehydratase reactivase beta/small subunit family protein [Pseudomonadota bacterium]